MIPCPGCGCVECLIGEDVFDGTLDDFTTSGTVTIGSGAMEMDGASSALYDFEPSANTHGVIITINATNAAASGTIRLVAAYVDSSNFVFGEVTYAAGVGTLRVGQVVGGSTTYLSDAEEVLDSGAELEQEHTISLCFTPGQPIEPEEREAFLYPASATASPGGGSTNAWVDVPNVLADDANTAAWDTSADSESPSDYIIATTFGFLPFIPQGSTIDGIAVSVSCWRESGGSPTMTLYGQLFTAAGGVGDIKNTGPLGSTESVLALGGAADDWNAGLDRDDVVDLSFGVRIQFTRTGGSIDNATTKVNYIAITVYFTTPEQTPGKVTLRFQNVHDPDPGDPPLECAFSTRVFAQTLGTGNGLIVSSGTWEIADYRLEYHFGAGHTDCPECDCIEIATETCAECCGEGEVPESLEAGSFGGWTDNNCLACDQVSGTYVLDIDPDIAHLISGGNPNIKCAWSGGDTGLDCVNEIECQNNNTEQVMAVGVVVYLLSDPVNEECTFYLSLVLGSLGDAQCDPFALYNSDPIPWGDVCTSFPVTLTKYSDSVAPVAGTCSGAQSGTITLDLP